jgi:hypothetical protein
MLATVHAKHKRDHQITIVSHPDASGEVIETAHLGNIRVVVGPAQYTLNTGEVVTL